MIRLACPECQAKVKVPDGAAGEEAECPECGAAFVVPDPDDADDAPPPRKARKGARGKRRAAAGELGTTELRQIALYQRGVLLAILAYLGLVAASFAVPENRLVLAVIAVPVAITSAVFVFLLAAKVYGPAGIALAVLTLVPLLGLIILLVVNQKATGTLQAAGYRVGLLGAPLSQFDAAADEDDE